MFGSLIQYLLTIGVPAYTLYALLALPMIALGITFSRYIVGWKSLNIYTNILMTFAFLEAMHITGMEYDIWQGLVIGSILVAPIAVLSLLMQKATSMVRMHYVAKVAGIMSVMALWTLGLVYIYSELGVLNLNTLHPLSMIIFIVVLDPFVKSYIRKGPTKSYKLILNTIGLSALLASIMALPAVHTFIMAFPESTIVAGLLSVGLGRWTGLRLSEVFRFKDININDDDPQHLQK